MYLENRPYEYPSVSAGVNQLIDVTSPKHATVVTGWHIMPNFLYRHVCRPSQWAEIQIQSEEFRPIGVDYTIYNPIPITSNLSLQRTNTFSAFNNCVYSMMYEDDCYETSWFPWTFVDPEKDVNLFQREGIIFSGNDQNQSENNKHPAYTTKKYIPPIYTWRRPNMRTEQPQVWGQGKQQAGVIDVTDGSSVSYLPNGIFWDPLVRGDKIGELRAGKNAYSWSFTHPDPHWHNTDQLAQYATWTVPGPYCGVGRPWTYQRTNAMDPDRAMTFGMAYEDKTNDNSGSALPPYDDYTIPNMAYMPIWCPNWFWKEIETNIIDWQDNNATKPSKKPDKYWGGTEFNAYKTTIPQWFAKGIPLFDENDGRIKTLTQVSVTVKFRLQIKKRRTAYNSAIWGPISGEQLYTATPYKLIMQPNCIRYRTHGTRMSWQNINTPTDAQYATSAKQWPREDNYRSTPQDESQRQYNTKHRPAGMLDLVGATDNEHPIQNKSGIRVRYIPGKERVVFENRKRNKTQDEAMESITTSFATQM